MMKKRFCPNCKSKNVRRDMNALTGAMGAPAFWICDDCEFSLPEFPFEEEENEDE